MDNNALSAYEGELVLTDQSGKLKNPPKLNIPQKVIDGAVQMIRTSAETQELLRAAKNSGDDLYRIIFKPEHLKGLKDGTLTWDRYSLNLRNASTKRYAGQITVGKLDQDTLSKVQALTSGITKAICSVAGQMQLAEISKKLDKLQDSVDLIREEAWRERLSELNGITQTINNALQFQNRDYAVQIVLNNIAPIESKTDFYRQAIEAKLTEKISLGLWDSFFESFFTIFGQKIGEYNDRYIARLRDFLGEHSFLVDCYIQAQALLCSCYSFIGEPSMATENADAGLRFLGQNKERIYQKMLYLLDIADTAYMEDSVLSTLLPLIEGRHIALADHISKDSSAMENGEKHLLEAKSNKVDAYIELAVDIPIDQLLLERCD